MTENILIEFNSNPEGLDISTQALKELGKVDKSLADQFTKTNEQIKQRDKLVDTLSGGLGDFVNKLKQADKAAVGAFGDKGIKDFRKSLIDTTNVSKLLFASIGAGAEKLKSLNKESAEFKKLNAEVEEATRLFGLLSGITEEVEAKAVSFKTQLRLMKQELAEMEDSGSTFSDKYQQSFEQLSIGAAKLEDQLGDTAERVRVLSSDTANLDAAVEGVTMLSTGFQIASGAAQLLGASEGDVQKALLKLNAIMAITQGLQQVQNFLRGQSILKLKLEAIANSVLSTATRATAATYQFLGISVQATSFAFKALRAAIISTGIGALVVGIGFLIEKLMSAKDATDEAAEAQERYNNAMLEAEQRNAGIRKNRMDANEDLKVMRQKIELAQQQGASQATLNNMEVEFAKKKYATLRFVSDEYMQDFKKAMATSLDELATMDSNLLDMANRIAKETDDDERAKLEKTKSRMDSEFNLKKNNYEANVTLLNDYNTAEQDLIKANAAKIKYANEQALKSATAFADAAVLNAKENSKEELNAQLAALVVRRKEELANNNLTQGEISKIYAQSAKERATIIRNFQIKELESVKAGLEGRLALVKQGSKEELDIKLEIIKTEQAISLKQVGLTELQIQAIRDKAQANRLQLVKEYEFKVAEETIKTRIETYNSKIIPLETSLAGQLNNELVQLKKEQLQEQAALEIIGVQNSVLNEKLKAAQILAINAKLNADIFEINKAKTLQDFDNSKAYSAKFMEQQVLLNKDLYNQKIISAATLAKLNSQLSKAEDAARIKELVDLKKQLDDKYISEVDYNNKVADITKATYEKKQAYAEQERQLQEQLTQAKTQLAENFFYGVTEAFQQKEIANLRAADAENQRLLDSKLITQAEYDKRARALKAREAKLEKESAIFKIVIEGAKQLFAIKAQAATLAANPLTAPLAAMAFAQIPFLLGAQLLQIGLIAARQPPGLWRGTKSATEGYYRVNEVGQESIWHQSTGFQLFDKGDHVRYVPEGARVYNAAETAAMLKSPAPVFELPTMSTIPDWAMAMNNNNQSSEIDYDKMGRKVAEHVGTLADMPGFELNVNEDGLALFVKNKNNRTQVLNTKYNLTK